MCAVKEPQSQELLESCEAWKPWQTPGGGGSEAAGGGGVRWGADGAKQHAGGVHALSGIPAIGLSLHGFFL